MPRGHTEMMIATWVGTVIGFLEVKGGGLVRLAGLAEARRGSHVAGL